MWNPPHMRWSYMQHDIHNYYKLPVIDLPYILVLFNILFFRGEIEMDKLHSLNWHWEWYLFMLSNSLLDPNRYNNIINSTSCLQKDIGYNSRIFNKLDRWLQLENEHSPMD